MPAQVMLSCQGKFVAARVLMRPRVYSRITRPPACTHAPLRVPTHPRLDSAPHMAIMTSARRECPRAEWRPAMTAPFSDTPPSIEALQIRLIRRMPAWKKMSIVDDLNETVKALAVSGIKQRHPHATPEQVQRMLAELVLGAELAHKVYDHAR